MFTLSAEFEPNAKGLLAVYLLTFIAILHFAFFGHGRSRTVAELFLGLTTAIVIVYGVAFRREILSEYGEKFEKLKLHDKLALLLVVALILIMFMSCVLYWREGRRKTKTGG